MQRRLEAQPSATLASRLIAELLLRYRILGHEQDLDLADTLVDRYLASHPERSEMALHRARIDALVHQFNAAEAVLRELNENPETGPGASILREIYLGTGRFSAAEAMTRSMERGLVGLANEGNIAIQKGEYENAARLFNRAQFQYRGVSPLVVSWLHVQHGVLHLRTGRYQDARAFFAAAYERLPQYYLATEHLAETEKLLGNLDAAAELYRAVIEQTQNPQFMAAMAEVEGLRGNSRSASAWNQKATVRYNELLSSRPAAWWGHGAEFFVESNPERALAMASQNAELRGDIGSWILLAEVSRDVGEWRSGCRAVSQIRKSPLQPPEKEEVLDSYDDRCR